MHRMMLLTIACLALACGSSGGGSSESHPTAEPRQCRGLTPCRTDRIYPTDLGYAGENEIVTTFIEYGGREFDDVCEMSSAIFYRSWEWSFDWAAHYGLDSSVVERCLIGPAYDPPEACPDCNRMVTCTASATSNTGDRFILADTSDLGMRFKVLNVGQAIETRTLYPGPAWIEAGRKCGRVFDGTVLYEGTIITAPWSNVP